MYNKSLDLMDEHLNSLSDDEFIALYSESEKHIGPTVKEYLEESEMTYEDKLTKRVKKMQDEDGLVDIRFTRLNNEELSSEDAAKNILAMLDAKVVPHDPVMC